jgi:hypothetical protein
MKSTELRIGNLVYPFKDTPKKVLGVGANILVAFTDSQFLDCEIHQIEPIPLTEEWLLKLGFEICYVGWFEIRSRFDGDYDEFSYNINTKEIHILQDSGRKYEVHLCNIQHVHQLQNLYFALTGEELTINEL